MKRLILLLSFLMMVGCIIAQPTSGKCGKNVTWTLQDDGTLVISGAGDTYDYSKKPQNSPFVKNGIVDRIRVVDLTRFHTDGHLSDNLFYGCRFLEKIILRQSQDKKLSKEVFSECTNLTTIEYANNTIYSSKSQNNYYKIMQNAMHVDIPTVVHCIVSDTSKKEEVLFKPLEPFPPIESYDNLRKEKKGGSETIGQWINGAWNGVVKHTWDGYVHIENYLNGEVVSDGPHKEEWHWPVGSWFIHEEFGNSEIRIDYFNSDHDKSPIRVYCTTQDDTQFVRWLFSNSDCFIGTFKGENGDLTGKNTLIWSNGAIYNGDFLTDGINFSNNGPGWFLIDFPDRSNSVTTYLLRNKREGKGIFYDPNTGDFQCGIWESGKYKGSPEVITLQDFFDFPKIIPFDIIAKHHIEKEINEWQKKGEFESTAEWQTRVTQASHQQKTNELYVQLQNDYVENFAKKINIDLQLGSYDADNSTYLVTDTVFGAMIVSVKNITPQAFKSSWDKIIPVPTYFINGNNIDILEMDFMLYDSVSQQYKRVAHYQKTADLTYQLADIEYNFEPFSLPQGEQLKSNGKINQPTYTPYIPSDVDINIPVVNKKNNNTFVYIIANENYSAAANVPFALNDGNTFKEYCVKTLGVNDNRVIYYKDATFGQMTECVERIKQVSEIYKEDATIIFYYAGHAFPDEASQARHLLPVDGNSRIPSTTYSLKNLYSELGKLPVKKVICFIDACFSGATRDDGMLMADRGVVMQPAEVPQGNLVVFTAADSVGTAHQYSDKRHGMFTYFLLKKLQDTKGDVSLKDLSDYVIDNVRKTSIDVNMKLQNPIIKISPAMRNKWQDIKLNE